MTTTKKTASAKELLSSLTAGKKPTTATNTRNRPELEVPAELEETFRRFIGADALEEIVSARSEAEKKMLVSAFFDHWVDRIWKLKTRPANPQVKIDNEAGKEDMSCIFQVVEKMSVTLPEANDNQTPAEVALNLFETLFTNTGMDSKQAKEAATKLVENEIDFTPIVSINLTKLIEGHYEGEGRNKTRVDASAEEQAIAQKTLALLNVRTQKDFLDCEPLTDKEAGMLIETKHKAMVKPNFLQRVCGYVHNIDQLRAIFTVLKPEQRVSGKKFAASDTPEEKTRRLLGVAIDILGVSVELFR